MASMGAIAAGLEILIPYGGPDDFMAEHDEIFACTVPPDKMKAEDVKSLDDLGWRWVENMGSWSKFT